MAMADGAGEATQGRREAAAAPAAGISEDWLALGLGLVIAALSLGVFAGKDLLGWGVVTRVWTDPSKALLPASKAYAGLPGPAALVLTYLAMTLMLGVGARLMGVAVRRFVLAFTPIFWIGYLCWFCGHYAVVAATRNQLKTFGLSWSLSLTGEAGFIVALLVGLVIGNSVPAVAGLLREATRPELYIKTAIVTMGAGLGVKAAESSSLARNVMFLGLCAIVAAYLIYWAVVYYVARRYFRFSREWSAPLASGISICGVSAAIATGGAIRARPIVPVMVSSLVVIFAVVEMVVLPFAAQATLWHEPLVAGAWMGLVVKTDGGAVASGAITDALIRARALEMQGIAYQEGWMTMTATTVKVFIDVFIGVWAFVLALVWCARIERKPGQSVRPIEIWQRFPKFVIGYALTFGVLLAVCLPAASRLSAADTEAGKAAAQLSAAEARLAATANPSVRADLAREIGAAREASASLAASASRERATMAAAATAADEGNVFRVLFFVLTFFTIGLVSNFRKLWEEGIGRLAAVYVLCLFGFIIWVGLFISWLFFHGVRPPVVAG
jgi:uncharacterized membrane protein YadS